MEKLADEPSIKREENREERNDEVELATWNRERSSNKLRDFIARREEFLRDQESRDAA